MLQPFPPSSPACIQTRGIVVRYANMPRPALNGIDLALTRGQRTVLLGANGAGKSTLLRVLAGLQIPTQGSLSGLAGEAPGSKAWRRQIGLVFQDHALIPRQSALWHILLGRLSHQPWWRQGWWFSERDLSCALQALAAVGLPELAQRRVRECSGGQRQRIGVARVLAQNPQVILADEPIASLDPRSAQTILDLLAAAAKERQAALLVTMHQVEIARQWAQRIIAIADGVIHYDGPPEGLDDEIIRTIYPLHQQNKD
ncbi:MAG: ATP-binding cassette domain-containing protein [Planctomycetota bacterium]|nr:MAG: ATP-binding cassette domain-containing protein [Planctomycetota bacterium]